jgi:hypothetical protein
MAIVLKPSRASVDAPVRRRSCSRHGGTGAVPRGRGLGTRFSDRRIETGLRP